MYTKVAARPSCLYALGWRRILVPRNYGSAAKEFRESIASMARNLAIPKVKIQEDLSMDIKAYLSCRLIPLDKLTGVRSIGVGEVIRSIIAKLLPLGRPGHGMFDVLVHNNCVQDNDLSVK